MDLFNSKMFVKKNDEQFFDKSVRYNLHNNDNDIIIDLPSTFNIQTNIDFVIRDGLNKQGDILTYEDIDYNNEILKKYKYVLFGTVFQINNDSIIISCGGLIVYVSGKFQNIKQYYQKQNVFILIN